MSPGDEPRITLITQISYELIYAHIRVHPSDPRFFLGHRSLFLFPTKELGAYNTAISSSLGIRRNNATAPATHSRCLCLRLNRRLSHSRNVVTPSHEVDRHQFPPAEWLLI